MCGGLVGMAASQYLLSFLPFLGNHELMGALSGIAHEGDRLLAA